MSNQKLAQIKTAGFILKPNAPEIKPLYEKIKAQFKIKGITALIDQNSAEMIGLEGLPFEKMCEDADFLVSLGGDGTILSLVRRSYDFNKPVVGINAGTLGFLADITIDDVDNFLDQLLEGEYRIDNRMMMEGYITTKKGKKNSFFALYYLLIKIPVISYLVNINSCVEGVLFKTFLFY
jgi:NAD+ kinase